MRIGENKMNKSIYIIAVMVLFFTSGCGTQVNSNTSDKSEESQNESTAAKGTSDNENETKTESNQSKQVTEDEILIVIDQTAKPIEGNSFDFVIKEVPEGFSFTEMQWISNKSQVINTVQEAIEHGASGEEGFYISGNGEYSGFFYSDAMKGEEGKVIFIFKDDQGKELTWEKTITLN